MNRIIQLAIIPLTILHMAMSEALSQDYRPPDRLVPLIQEVREALDEAHRYDSYEAPREGVVRYENAMAKLAKAADLEAFEEAEPFEGNILEAKLVVIAHDMNARPELYEELRKYYFTKVEIPEGTVLPPYGMRAYPLQRKHWMEGDWRLSWEYFLLAGRTIGGFEFSSWRPTEALAYIASLGKAENALISVEYLLLRTHLHLPMSTPLHAIQGRLHSVLRRNSSKRSLDILIDSMQRKSEQFANSKEVLKRHPTLTFESTKHSFKDMLSRYIDPSSQAGQMSAQIGFVTNWLPILESYPREQIQNADIRKLFDETLAEARKNHGR